MFSYTLEGKIPQTGIRTAVQWTFAATPNTEKCCTLLEQPGGKCNVIPIHSPLNHWNKANEVWKQAITPASKYLLSQPKNTNDQSVFFFFIFNYKKTIFSLYFNPKNSLNGTKSHQFSITILMYWISEKSSNTANTESKNP